MKNTDISIFAAPFGFGPLGKAIAIAQAFNKQKISVKILTDSVGMKIVNACGLECEFYEYKKTLNLSNLNTKVAISSLDISTPIIKSGIPLVLYDSLFWLRGVWEHVPKYNEDLYIAQKFFFDAPTEIFNAVKDHFYFVDAVLPISIFEYDNNLKSKKIVLYPGGLKSPHLPIEYQEEYFFWISNAILQTLSNLKINFKNFITIVPPQLIDLETANYLRKNNVNVVSAVSNLSKYISQAKAFIIAPGIETMLESLALGKLPLYLPAYIAPHIPQLVAFRNANIGIELCPTFNDEVFKTKSTKDMSSISKEMLNFNSKNLYVQKYQTEIINNLTKFLINPVKINDRFPLGYNGAEQIVEIIKPLI